ncbi:MAG: hypothetical protein AB8H86_27325 [Polyangiales bacterium]
MTIAVDADPRMRARYAELEGGDFSEVEALIQELEAAGTERARAHLAALRAHLWFADASGGALPELSDLARWAQDASCHDALSRCALLHQLGRLLAFDVAGVTEMSKLAASVHTEDPAIQVRLNFAKLATDFVQGERPEEVWAGLSEVFEGAKKAQLAGLAIDAQCAMAIAAMIAGDLTQATAISRRASRMARTEGLPQQQYWSNLLLARVRRLNGVPHLATHILNALMVIAPSPYQPWIRWERLLAGTIVGDGPAPRQPVEWACVALDRVLDAAMKGEREALVHSKELLERVAAVPLVRSEARDLCVGIDAFGSTDAASDAMDAWLQGASALPPHGLYGVEDIATGEVDADRRDVGYILAGPDRRARRVLGFAKAPGSADLHDEKRTDRRRIRIETGIAVLALAAGPIADSVFFRQVYGFDHNPIVHAAVLDALVSRMRKALAGVATLERVDGALSLTFVCLARLPDPRCAQPLEDRVLRVLVRAQDGTAKDAAMRLGLPLRTIQEALKELIDGGACAKRREGRKIAYVIEDTTFAPPTQSGVR